MPLGAFVSSPEKMSVLSHNPMLGHLTTSGGHAVSCAASLAALKIVSDPGLLSEVHSKEKLFHSLLKHSSFLEVRGKGLMLALRFADEATNQKVISLCFERGLLTDWFLFAPDCLRLAPPLTISEDDIRYACSIILEASEKNFKIQE
jgi:acetylornithine/succinyldiaminopimelate/putrescine aminotransferase